jgi:TolB-like protein
MQLINITTQTLSSLKKTLTVALSVISILSITACTTYIENDKFKSPSLAIDGSKHTQNSMLIAKRTYDAVDNLLERSQLSVEKNKPLVVATVVDVSNVEQSSSLGRLMTEQISGRAVQLGYQVIEPKLRNNFAVKGSGELVLSRDADLLKRTLTAQAVIAGTYAVGYEAVHVNLKLLELDTGRVLSSSDYLIPSSDWTHPDTKVLLSK